MKYLLDTNICIYLIKNNPEKVIKHFSKKKPGDIFISSITVSELYFGVAKSARQNENLVALKEFLQPLSILEFTEDDAIAYGGLRTQLEQAGTPIGAMDMLIAAHALSRGLVIVTNKEKEFRKVNGLVIENWANS